VDCRFIWMFRSLKLQFFNYFYLNRRIHIKMTLNYIWIAFFVLAFIAAMIRLLLFGDTEVMSTMMQTMFDSAKNGFNVSIGITGVLTLWLGLLKIGEQAGVVNTVAKLFRPFFRRIFPDIPKDHPVHGTMMMNIASTMLGLDNAATPIGLKAMKQLQELNPVKEVASRAQIMFLVLNTAGFTLVPVSIMVYRAQMGAANPADVFLPILIATTCAALTGIIAVSIMQKINIVNRVTLGYFAAIIALVGSMLLLFSKFEPSKISMYSSIISSLIIMGLINWFIIAGMVKKINVFETFIEGAKEGFTTAIKIIPYLVALLVGVGLFRSSGILDMIIGGVQHGLDYAGIDSSWVPALPVAFMKPLSGSGARGLMVEAMQTYGADSLVGRMVSIMQGSTDTTFYILAVYFGSVNIKRSAYAVGCGLIADFAGLTAAVFLTYLFFT